MAAASGDLLTPTLTDHRPRDWSGRLPWRLSSLVYASILGGPVAAGIVAVINAQRLRMGTSAQWALAVAALLGTAGATALVLLVEGDVTRPLVAVCGLLVYGVAYRLERSPDRVHATFSPHDDPDSDHEPFLAAGIAAVVAGWCVLLLVVGVLGGPA